MGEADKNKFPQRHREQQGGKVKIARSSVTSVKLDVVSYNLRLLRRKDGLMSFNLNFLTEYKAPNISNLLRSTVWIIKHGDSGTGGSPTIGGKI